MARNDFKINCPMCKSFVKEFFTHAISLTVRDLVIAHLLLCKECLDEYTMYAVNIGLHHWDIKKEAKKLIMSCGEHPEKCIHTKDAWEKIENIQVTELQHNKYTRATLNWDIATLKELQAFSDMICFTSLPKGLEPTDENYIAFWKHEILKVAKHIDHLEECLAKSKETLE